MSLVTRFGTHLGPRHMKGLAGGHSRHDGSRRLVETAGFGSAIVFHETWEREISMRRSGKEKGNERIS